MMTHTRTYAILEVSERTFEDVRKRMEEADSGDAVHEHSDGVVVDMHGVALRAEAPPAAPPSPGLAKLEEDCRDIGRTIRGALPPGAGFVLVLADFVAGGSMTFVSSIERAGAVKMLRELADKIEGS